MTGRGASFHRCELVNVAASAHTHTHVVSQLGNFWANTSAENLMAESRNDLNINTLLSACDSGE